MIIMMLMMFSSCPNYSFLLLWEMEDDITDL